MAGHITKRGKDTWRIRITFGTDANGKRRSFNATVHGSKKDAEKFLTAKLREKDTNAFIEPSAITLDSYLDKWLEESACGRLAASTFEQYSYLLRLHVRPVLGSRRLSDIRLSDIQSICSDLTTNGLSPRTVRYVHSILSGAFKSAIKWKYIVVNPCAGVDLPKMDHKEMKAFTPEEARQFMEACSVDRLGLVFKFALVSGMRPEEYLALKWTDIDLERSTATIQRVLVRKKFNGNGWYFATPKTQRSRRSVPIPEEIIGELRLHRKAQRELMMKLGGEYERNDLVFASDFGRPLDLKNIRTRNFARILKAAGLSPDFRIYDLRHSTATLMLANGENPKVVSERLGHASIVLTLDTYSHVLPSIQKEATNRLGKVLFG